MLCWPSYVPITLVFLYPEISEMIVEDRAVVLAVDLVHHMVLVVLLVAQELVNQLVARGRQQLQLGVH